MDKIKLQASVLFKAVRSSGAGGQNVNKVSSKVVLTLDIENAEGISLQEKEILQVKLLHKLTQENLLIVTCQEDRSQLKNKEIAFKKLYAILEKALTKPKVRKKTKIPKRVIEKRLKQKKQNAAIKQNRKPFTS